jgi:hypothetical protein
MVYEPQQSLIVAVFTRQHEPQRTTSVKLVMGLPIDESP